MPRSIINLADHKNLWGVTATHEPQRGDLWLVDLTDLVNGLNKQKLFEKLKLAAVPKLLPQFVQSVTFPELKVKPEVYRRDSVPFNMPSWDEPLDAVKISFLVDTYENSNQSMVVSTMQAWQAIVRAGRGSREGLYNPSANWIPLNENYRYDYTFPIRIAQLRGGTTEQGQLSIAKVEQLNQSMVYRSQRESDFQDKLQGLISAGDVETAVTYLQVSNLDAKPNFQSLEKRPLENQPWLSVSGNWILKDCWLAGWKLSDHSYSDSKLATLEATIYAEDLYQFPI